MRAILLCLVLLVTACLPKSKSPAVIERTDTSLLSTQTERTLSELLDSLQVKKEALRILIDKSDYKLYVIADTTIVKAYATVFGSNPIADKLMQGDQSTPEGNFKVRAFYPHKSWSKFIWIDYPNASSWEKHNKAKAENVIPANAAIGGEIGIHGVPKNSAGLVANKFNWTAGCISLSNEDVNELYTIIYKNMPIEITK